MLEDFCYYYYSFYYFVPLLLFVLLGWRAAAVKQQLLEDLAADFLYCVVLGKIAASQPVQVKAILYNFMGICQSISHCWKVLGFFVCLFLLRPCSKLFKYTLEKAICSLNTAAPYLYSLQNLLSPRPWFPRFSRVPVKINHIRGMTFMLSAI